MASSNSINKQLNNRIKNSISKPDGPEPVSTPKANDFAGDLLKKINSSLDETANYLKKFSSSDAGKATTNKTVPSTKETSIKEPMMYVTDNYIIILGLFLAFIILVLLYFFSKTFNVGRVKEKMKLYNLYQKITDFDYRKTESGTLALKDVRVASAYNAANMGSQFLSYTSEHILAQVLRSGARYIELNVFSSKFGKDGIPVIDGGFKKGEWKLMLNSTTFEQAIITIAQNAFKPLEPEGGAPNNGDPLFLALNLSTGHNIYCLDKVADILVDYFSDKLLEPKYAYQFNKNIQDIKMNEIQGKVIIFASSGYEGSKLEELVNSTWVDETGSDFNILANTEGFANRKSNNKDLNNIKKSMNKKGKRENKRVVTSSTEEPILEDKTEKLADAIKKEFGGTLSIEKYQDVVEQPSLDDDMSISTKPNIIRIVSSVFNNPGFDGSRIKNHNKNGLTIVVPHIEGDFITRNYDPTPAIDLGCQFIAMNYQEIDENMDTYITLFETHGILPIKQ